MKIVPLVAFSPCPLVVATAFVTLHKPIIGKSVVGKDQAARAPLAANPHIVESPAAGSRPVRQTGEVGDTLHWTVISSLSP